MQLQRKTEPSNQIGEKAYRELKDRLSYSSLRLYSQSRSRFMKEVVLGEVKEKDQTLSTILGDMVHVILANQEGEWDSKFIMCQSTKPTGQILELTEALYRRTLRSLSADGIQQDTFPIMFQDAFNSVKYEYDGVTEKAFKKKTMEWALEKFQAEGEMYYQELINSTGKTVVTVQQIEQAEKLVEMLKSHSYTRDIINLQSSGDIEVFNELVILYEIAGIKYRSMVDKLVVNHENKTIQIWDYKCTWSNEEGFEYTYLKNGYYLQVGLYQVAVQEWGIEHKLDGYRIEPMRYIAIDTTGQNAPVIYQCNDKDVLLGQRGFTVRGKKYPGVLAIHKDIQWNLSTGNWTTSERINQNNGVVGLDIVYR